MFSLALSEEWRKISPFSPLDLGKHEAIFTPVSSGSGLLLVLEYHDYAIEFDPVLYRSYSLV
jgi:hypothetical protein